MLQQALLEGEAQMGDAGAPGASKSRAPLWRSMVAEA